MTDKIERKNCIDVAKMTNVLSAFDIPTEPTCNPGDYRDEEGFLCCGTCGERKEACFDNTSALFGGKHSRMCRCELEKLKQQEQEEEAQKLRNNQNVWRARGIPYEMLRAYTFANDEYPADRVGAICRTYSENFAELPKQGIFLYGGNGTGKTYYAAAIVNDLIDRGTEAAITTIPDILHIADMTERNNRIETFIQVPFLVLDDIGVESGTEYRREVFFQIVDGRYKNNLPLCCTSNDTPNEWENRAANDKDIYRIWSRINAMCSMKLSMQGENRREIAAKENQQRAVMYMSDALSRRSAEGGQE